MLPLVVFIFISIQLLVVAYTDLRTQKISNVWLIINVIFFIVLTFIFPNEYALNNLGSFIYSLAFVFVGFGLYMLNIMGGGDSKYLSSIYLLIPMGFQEKAFLYLLYTTIIVGSTLLLFNILQNFDKLIIMLRVNDLAGVKKVFGKKFTYAPVIFIAWMWFGWQYRSLIGY